MSLMIHRRAQFHRTGISIFLVTLVLIAFAVPGPVLAVDTGLSEAAGRAGLTQGSIPAIIAGIISVALGLVGVVFLLLMLYGGFLWMTARGNTETVEKAKTTITSAVIGIIIVASAYAVTSFVVSRIGNAGQTQQQQSEGDGSSWLDTDHEFALISTVHAQNLGQDLLEQTGKEADLQTGSGDQEDRLPVIVGNLIRAFISLLGVIFLVLIVYGGWLWLTARGESDRVEKAKDTITRAVIGLIIVVSAYAVTSFVVGRLIQTAS